MRSTAANPISVLTLAAKVKSAALAANLEALTATNEPEVAIFAALLAAASRLLSEGGGARRYDADAWVLLTREAFTMASQQERPNEPDRGPWPIGTILRNMEGMSPFVLGSVWVIVAAPVEDERTLVALPPDALTDERTKVDAGQRRKATLPGLEQLHVVLHRLEPDQAEEAIRILALTLAPSSWGTEGEDWGLHVEETADERGTYAVGAWATGPRAIELEEFDAWSLALASATSSWVKVETSMGLTTGPGDKPPGLFLDVGLSAAGPDKPPKEFPLGSWWRASSSWGPGAGTLARVDGRSGNMINVREYPGEVDIAILATAFGESWRRVPGRKGEVWRSPGRVVEVVGQLDEGVATLRSLDADADKAPFAVIFRDMEEAGIALWTLVSEGGGR